MIQTSHLSTLIEQFADALEQVDLCCQERAQFGALLDALRMEATLCQVLLS